MAPTLHRRDSPVQLSTWLIVVAVVASVVVTALIIYLVIFCLRNKQYQEAAKRDPYLTRKEWARRRKLSNLERLEEEEVQRQLILRKTLTSRTSSRNDSIFESRRDASSAEEPRKEPAKSRDDDWKQWEAGYGPEVEPNDSEGHPLIEQHPAIKGDEDQLARSISPTRAPLLPAQEPESWRTSLGERRLSDLHNNSLSMRESANSPPRAPPSSSSDRESIIERPHITAHPAHHPLHNSSSPRHARSAGELQRRSPSHRFRSASTDTHKDANPRSAALSLHSRASSNPVIRAPSQHPNSSRPRSNSAFTTPSRSLLSPPPPVALPRSTSPSRETFLGPELGQPRIPTQRARSLTRVLDQPTQEQVLHTRARSHEMLPFFRKSSPSPAQSPRRKPVPFRALSGKTSASSLASGTRAAVVSPTVSPVEEATLESERVSVSPGATLCSDEPRPFPEKEGLVRMAASDRDILPSRLQETLQLDPMPSPPRQNNSSSEDSQPSSYDGEGFFEGPQAVRDKRPAQPEQGPSSPRHGRHEDASRRLTPPRQRDGHLDAGNDEVGTAFSFEIGDHLKELGISVRKLPARSPSPPAVVSEPRQQQIKDDSEDDEVSSTFSSEEEVYLKELGVPIQTRGTQRPSESYDQPSQQPTYIDPGKQRDEAAFSFEEDSQLKEMELTQREPLQRRNSPLTHLEIPRLNKDRSRSFEDRDVRQPGVEITPDAMAQRLRSRSFEPVAQGRWQLQVSVLDQTGARHSRTSKDGGESDDFYSSESEPTSPEEETRFNEDIPLAPLIVPSRPGGAPGDVKGASTVHNRTPSTPLTSPDSDTSGLCRANFASPIKEKQLAEEQLAARSPPPYQSLYSPPPPVSPAMYTQPAYFAPHMQNRQPYVSPPMHSASTFGSFPMQSPHGFVSPQTEAGWTVASPGWRPRETMEADYGRDTMKETFAGPQATGSDGEKSKVSFRLSGPPDFMPAFF